MYQPERSCIDTQFIKAVYPKTTRPRLVSNCLALSILQIEKSVINMIYIIRHGQTELNNAHVLQGRSNHPLNENGIKQALEASLMLQRQGVYFDHVFSSPLIRAIQTAEIIAPEMKPIVDERLIEMDYGAYEGADLNNPAPELQIFFRDFIHNPAPAGMEQLSDVIKRTGAFLEEIREIDGNILISTHAIAMKGMLEYLTPDARGSYWSTYIGNCSVYITENTNGNIGIPAEMK